MNRVLLVGSGYLGQVVARLFIAAGDEVAALCAHQDTPKRLAGKPYPILPTDVRSKARLLETLARFPDVDTLVYCVSTKGGDEAAYRELYLEGLRNSQEVFWPRRLIFVSSTSVYGQTDGSAVHEEAPTEPARETGKVLLEAEKYALDQHGSVARLAGIYGPKHSIYFERFLNGEAEIEGDGERWINQIYRDDAAAALVHLAHGEMEPGIYNVCDDTPATQRQVYQWLAEFFDRPIPPKGEADPNKKRGLTNKRISNKKLKETGWRPEFPSFKEALTELARVGL